MNPRLIILLVGLLSTQAFPASAATFSVITTNDNGTGTFRQAILDANASPGPDIVTFNIASGGRSILPTQALPTITDELIIDGTTQPGFSGQPLIELNGTASTNGTDGLRIAAGPVTIRSLLINRFKADGIRILGGAGHSIEGCVIGLDATGSDQGNTLNGISITNSPGVRIGGFSPAQANTISGNNQNGVAVHGLASSNLLVLGNLIGLNPSGTTPRGNSANGLFINGTPFTSIGGPLPGERNVISGNNQQGIRIEGPTAFSNALRGNIIGLNAAATVAAPNSQTGVLLFNAPSNTVGGPLPGQGNLISGNSGSGIQIEGASARANTILGNVLGLDGTGIIARGNGGNGVRILTSASFNRIGGTSIGEGNTLWFNAGDGILIEGGTNNTTRGNSTFGNTGLGLDLGLNGVTANDALDADTGANQLQNFPVLTAATNLASGLVAVGTITGRIGTPLTIDFYSSPARDPTGNGEGQVYLGSTSVTNDTLGNATFALTLPRQAAGRFLAATATDTNGNTSEFSPAIPIASALPPQTFTVTTTANSGPGSLRQAILDANLAITTTHNVIAFNIPGPGPHTLVPTSALPPLSEPVVIDGFSQPGATPNTSPLGNNALWKIQLIGTNAGATTDGLRMEGSNSIVRGLVIAGFTSDGVEIATNSLNRIEGCLIGLNITGQPLGNTAHGIHINQAPNTTIGGETPAARNVISGNTQHGILLSGTATSNAIIAGNLIGTGPDGTGDAGNGGDGIQINAASFNTIGGTNAHSANIISGNNSDGIELTGASTTANTIAGNRIGLNALDAPLGNNSVGVRISSNARTNRIGLPLPGGGNTISFNGAGGVEISAGTNNTIRANSISANGGLGIDLGANGSIQANDALDPDTGPNSGQNFPILATGRVGINATTVQGTLNSRAGTAFTIDLYASEDPDPSGNGEGRVWLGSTTATTDASGNATFIASLQVAAPGRYLTATATDPLGNTSEFSSTVTATSDRPGETFTVVNTQDSGPGSLRQAILDANTAFNAGDRIVFHLPGPGPHTFRPTTPLPTITDTLQIDGFTQPGSATNTLADGNNAILTIRIDGAAATGSTPAGLRIRANGCEVRGLCIIRAGTHGIDIAGVSGTAITGCQIGIDLDGLAQRNSSGGVRILDAPATRIGGTSPADRTVISGNFGAGIHFEGTGSSNGVVQGCFIGTGVQGTNAVANLTYGILVDASDVLIGGPSQLARNIISGNSAAGIQTFYLAPDRLRISGNHIGTDVTGTSRIPNREGITLATGSGHQVGGTTPAEGNLIAGNRNVGILIAPSSAGLTRILGNRIGIGRDGLLLTNGSYALQIGASSNQVGGVLTGQGNIIGGGHGAGVHVSGGTGNSIRGNSISLTTPQFGTGLGIDLAPLGVTVNDPGDTDSGANGLQNFPVITAATTTGTETRIQGTLNSSPSASFDLDFYSSPTPNTSGHGEGLTFLGTTRVTTDPSGLAAFNVTLPIAATGRFLTAVATDATGSSSEFSAAFGTGSTLPPRTFTVLNTNDSGPGSLRQALLDASQSVASSNHSITFAIPGAGPHRIRPSSPLPTPIEPVTIDGFTQPGSAPNTSPTGADADWRVELDGSLLGFGSHGLHLRQPGSVVRGLKIAGFYNGILLGSASNLVLEGSLIVSNTSYGVVLSNTVAARIGGTLPAARNRISANGSGGLELLGPLGHNNTIHGNLIGTDASGTASGGAQHIGIAVADASNNHIGGTGPGEANLIAFHGSAGVFIHPGTNNTARGNRIFENGSLGIDLFLSGLTPNDPDDADDGGNQRQNFPVLTSAAANAGTTLIQGSLQSRANTTFTVDFYSSAAKDLSEHGEGEFHLGSTEVTTDSSGNATINTSLPVTAPGRYLTATATDPAGNTSEFSQAIEPVSAQPGLTYTVTNTNDSGPGSFRQALLDVDAFANATPDRIVFNIPGDSVNVISPLTPLPVPQYAVEIDGFSQRGATPNSSTNTDNAVLRIQVDGALMQGFGPGLAFTSRGNTVKGLSLTRFGSQALRLGGLGGNVITGCRLGVTPAGLGGTNGTGISISSPDNRVGGSAPAARNLIAANEDYGVALSSSSASNNLITGNFIGLLAPTTPLGNGRDGIVISGANHNTLGGNAADGNLIGFNVGNGVNVLAGLGNVIQGNRFLANGRPPVSVANGAHGNIQPPVLTAALLGSVQVKGTYSGLPNTTYELEAFVDYEIDLPLSYGDPIDISDPLGRFQVTTDAQGKASYDHTFDRKPPSGRVRTHVQATGPAQGTSGLSEVLPLFPADKVDLTFKIRIQKELENGLTINGTVVVENIGPTPASETVADIFYPPGSGITGITGGGSPAISGNTAKVPLGSIPPGGRTEFTIVSQTAGQDVFPVAGTVTSAQPDQNPDDNTAGYEAVFTRTSDYPLADIAVELPGIRQEPFHFRDDDRKAPVATPYIPLPFKVRVTNKGTQLARNVPVTFLAARTYSKGERPSSWERVIIGDITAPPGVTSVVLGNDPALARCTITELPPLATVEILVSVVWVGGAPERREGSFAARTIYPNDFNPFNDSATTLVYVSATQIAVTNSANADGQPSLKFQFPAQPSSQLFFNDTLPGATGASRVPDADLERVGDFLTYSVPLTGPDVPPQRFYFLQFQPDPLPSVPRIVLNQQTWHLPGGLVLEDTDFGQLTLLYPGTTTPRYLTLWRGLEPVIHNVPVLSPDGPQVPHEMVFTFPMGNFGQSVLSGDFAWRLTDQPGGIDPQPRELFPVRPTHVTIAPGEAGKQLIYFPARPMAGTQVLETTHNEPVFPNREQGLNECAVAGLANSLEYLNTRHQLAIDPAKISVDKLKEVVQWHAGGAPVGDDVANPLWAQRKKEYLAANDIPVTTEITSDPVRAMQALGDNCNIEIRVTGHAACLRAMARMDANRHVLVISHDQQQGEPGGTILETLIYNSATGEITGGAWTNGRKLTAFAIECALPQ